MQALLRRREPIAVAVLVLVAARPLLVVAALALHAIGVDDPSATDLAADPVGLLVLAALVVWCGRSVTAHHRAIAGAAVAAGVGSLLMFLVTAGSVIAARPWPVLVGYALIAGLEVVGVAALVAVAHDARHGAGAADQAGRRRRSRAEPAVVPSARDDSSPHRASKGADDDSAAAARATVEEPSIWEPDQAAGTVWLSAEAAASGAAGQTGGDQGHGWVPLQSPHKPAALPGDDAPNRPE